MMDNVKRIDYTPEENAKHVSNVVAGWLLENAFMALNERGVRDIENFSGNYLNLSLGGYARHPDVPGSEVNVETSFNVELAHAAYPDDEYEDPSGDRWYKLRLNVQVSWPSYGGCHSWRITQMRADLIAATIELGNRFLAHFDKVDVWVRGSTKAQRDEQHLRWRRDATTLKVANHVKEAIRTTCKLMRVGNERFISCPDGDLVSGTYEVEVKNKTYHVEVRDKAPPANAATRFHFRRVK